MSKISYHPAMETTLVINSKKRDLFRFPKRSNEVFQAWNAADEYAIEFFFNKNIDVSSNILIINDSYGGISCFLDEFKQTVWSDSYTALQAITENRNFNKLDNSNIKLLPITEIDTLLYDFILIKIPKTLSLLEFQLKKISQVTRPNTQVLGFGMTKEIRSSVIQLFDSIIGETHTSLAKKKARLIHSAHTKKPILPDSPTTFQLEDTPLHIVNYPNVFAKDKLDIGTRLLIKNLPEASDINSVIDLGCGSGILALTASEKYPNAVIYGTDDSYLAVKSADETFRKNNKTSYSFFPSNAFENVPDVKVDLILCNPPFHQDHKQSDHIAWKMFSESFYHLNKDGFLYIVGNRHLNYHIKLKRIFGNCEIVDSNRKFVILKSKR